MSGALRFTAPISTSRPFKSHRYDVYGLKIGRFLSHYSLPALYAWVSLEADPRVTAYCERPLIVPDRKPRIAIDFWVKYLDHEELWILHRPGEFGDENDLAAAIPAFAQWAEVNNLRLRPINKSGYQSRSTFLDNWGQILRELTSNSRYVSGAISRLVQEAFDTPRPLAALEGLYPDEDPVLLRTGAFSLLHSGFLKGVDMDEQVVGPSLVLERSV